jgi:hypothetical protein
MNMVKTQKKYVANIDFLTAKSEKGHKIHLNPYFVGSALREKILSHYDPEKDKIPRDGGSVYLTRDEAAECLNGERQIQWQGRNAYPLRSCKICSRLREWDLML